MHKKSIYFSISHFLGMALIYNVSYMYLCICLHSLCVLLESMTAQVITVQIQYTVTNPLLTHGYAWNWIRWKTRNVLSFIVAHTIQVFVLCISCTPLLVLSVSVSTRRIAYQSDTESGAVARRAIDGNRDVMFTSGRSCSMTPLMDDPWFVMNLRDTFKIQSVTITNRGDCCGK